MPSITLNAHFDGQQITLDEPFEILFQCQIAGHDPGNARSRAGRLTGVLWAQLGWGVLG